MQTRYEELIATKKANNQNFKDEQIVLEAIKGAISNLSGEYENAKTKADAYYNAVKSGMSSEELKEVGISEDDIKWMQEFNGLTDNQIQILKTGTDVKREDSEATNEVAEMTEYLNGVEQENAELIQNSLNTVQQKSDAAQQAIEAENKSIDELQSSYTALKTAVDEYNNSGTLTLDTFQALTELDPSYLSGLEMIDGQLRLNSQSLEEEINKLKLNSTVSMQNAAARDIMNYTMGNTEALSKTAKNALAGLNDNIQDSGNSADENAKKLANFAAGVASIITASGGSVNVDDSGVQAIVGAYEKAARQLSSFTISTVEDNKKTSKATKSSSEAYKATIDTLYNYNNALDIAKNRVSALEKELKNTDNLEEQEKITRQLVNALNDQIKATNDLKNAQTSQINDYINQLRQQGFVIDYNNQTNELYINNMQHLADFSGDTAKNLEKLIKNIQSLNKDNVSLDGSVRDLSASTKDYYDQLEKFPEKKLKQYQDLMKDFQQSQLDQVQDQIDDLEHALEQDPQLKALKDQLEAMKAQTDEKDKQAELEEKMLAVEKAREALENARRQKTLQVYREGQGWVNIHAQ